MLFLTHATAMEWSLHNKNVQKPGKRIQYRADGIAYTAAITSTP